MNDLALTRDLEQYCFNAWPAVRTMFVGGWIVRLSDGHTRRANSANALYPLPRISAELVDRIVALFRRAGLAPVFRLTPLAPKGCAALLHDRGFYEDDPSFGMFADSLVGGALQRVTIEAAATAAWINGAMQAYGYGAAAPHVVGRLLSNLVLPAAFATLWQGDEPAAWGLAVAEAQVVGLYDLVVAPPVRGRGFGRQLIQALLTWGQAQGAAAAYLQVRASNAGARALYRTLGFRDAYRYTHWVLAAAPDAATAAKAIG